MKEGVIPYTIAKNGDADLYLNLKEKLEETQKALEEKYKIQVQNYTYLTQKTGVRDNRNKDLYTKRSAVWDYSNNKYFFNEGKGQWLDALLIKNTANHIVNTAGEIAELIYKHEDIEKQINALLEKSIK